MLWTAPPAGARAPWNRLPLSDHDLAGANMQAISTIGLDIAKSVFQVHGRQSAGGQLRRIASITPAVRVPLPFLIGHGPQVFGDFVPYSSAKLYRTVAVAITLDRALTRMRG